MDLFVCAIYRKLVFVSILAANLQGVSAGLDQQYIGCYNDTLNPRVLPTQVRNDQNLTLEQCRAACYSSSSYPTYFGAENTTYCFCGDYYTQYGAGPSDSSCNMPCGGDTTQFCGGYYLISVYSVCSPNTYGADCSSACHCKNNTICIRSNGTCINGCQDGFGGATCKDINECAQENGGCNQMCTNSPGSFVCSCLKGYYNLTVDSRLCNDINECAQENGGCNQMCTNSPGSFACSCLKGYYNLSVDSRLCKDMNECAQENGGCNQMCTNSPGSFACSCLNGYYNLTVDSRLCNDTNECAKKNGGCNHTCTNTPGSFTCSCYSGYINLTTDSKLCHDIDECVERNGGCSQTCTNTPGSFTCSCLKGFYNITVDSRLCNDTNECAKKNGGCNQTCTNTPGSFSCSCYSGYYKVTSGCHDIDECSLNISSCNQTCNNTMGSFSCSCDTGYYNLTLDSSNCQAKANIKGPDSNAKTVVPAVIIPILVCTGIAIAVLIYFRQMEKKKETNRELHPATVLRRTSVQNNHRMSIYPVTSPATDIPEGFDETNVIYEMRSFIKVSDLPAHYALLKKPSSNVGDEFKAIAKVSVSEKSDFAALPALKGKNRFKNILPYDKNRVRMTETNANPLSGYINASFIQGYCSEDKIIAAQGPIQETVNDFWRMIWEQEVSTIIMLTKVAEEGKTKCEQYWPDNDQQTYDEIIVSHLSSKESSEYTIRTFSVTKHETERTIVHLQFTEWPDYGVPENALPLLCFMQRATQYIDKSKFTLYHCSAGVGRTGTILAIDFLLSAAAETGEVDVLSCVKDLREQRMNCVQTLIQYIFIFQALSEAVQAGNSCIVSSAVGQRVAALHDLNSVTGKSVLESEFSQLMGKATMPQVSGKTGTSNIFVSSTAVKSKAVLKKDKKKIGIFNAVHVQAFEKPDGYIVTHPPPQHTAEEFWNMCIDYDSKLMLVLTESELCEDDSFIPSQSSSRSQGHIQIKTVSREASNMIEECQICRVSAVRGNQAESSDISENDEYSKIIDDNMVIVLARVSRDMESVGERLASIHHVMKSLNSGNLTQRPIVVLSRFAALCGQYIAVSYISDMITVYSYVDVIHAVLEVKKSLPHFLANPQEYEELYYAARKCANRLSLPIYNNVL